jgi:hypothetical protein
VKDFGDVRLGYVSASQPGPSESESARAREREREREKREQQEERNNAHLLRRVRCEQQVHLVLPDTQTVRVAREKPRSGHSIGCGQRPMCPKGGGGGPKQANVEQIELAPCLTFACN